MRSPRNPQLHAVTKATIVEAFDIDPDQNELVCLVGAGGKTTTLFRVARELKRLTKRVLVTTTTAILCPSQEECDEVIVNSSNDPEIFAEVTKGSVSVFGSELLDGGKLKGIDKEFIDEIYKKNIFDHIIVEGDGSKQRPIKAPAYYEPVIPQNTTRAIGVVGLDAIGKRADSECVHRMEEFTRVTGYAGEAAIDEEAVALLIVSQAGLFKSVPEGCQKYLLLNKAENKSREESAMNIIERVKKSDSTITGFLVANMINGSIKRIG
jgi:probable selenium-dependent hydroxylase accessory protein YqeC